MDHADFTNLIKVHASAIRPVVSFHSGADRLLAMDFTEANHELTDHLLSDSEAFTSYISSSIARAGARYGIGGYAEHRTVYRMSSVFDGAEGKSEPRRLHLGTDIWGAVGTVVMTPLDGWVHSFAFNNQSGDYGATIILKHELAGIIFYTLYGHLALKDIQDCKEGAFLPAGSVFAHFGNWSENGGWPPHLHFQLILDIGLQKGDYPGVCPYSEKDHWLANCPDPDNLLQLNQYLNK
ncbi:MAG: peptidoglycan DD-metalloendopeptidase family protein [Chitinophagaceae bacterium]|nr:peptidoglycan DD-metalloendopeptidase family protein [Chitinophagaceae bacterium]